MKLSRHPFRTGALAGLINGLFGTGGGTVFLLSSLKEEECDPRAAFTETLALSLALSTVSLGIYGFRGAISSSGILRFCLPALPGGLLGAWLQRRCSPQGLKRLFALLTALGGLFLLFR